MHISAGGGRKLVVVATIAVAGFAAGSTAMLGATAQTTLSVVQASADSYAVGATASVLGSKPIHVGPVSLSSAYIPPGTTQSNSAALVNCSITGPCLDPLVDNINVLQSNTDVGLQQVKTTCDGAPPGFGGDKIVGANGCVTIASVSALNTGTAAAPTPFVFASAVTAQSQFTGCNYQSGKGKVEIANLTVGGTEVVGPNGIDLTPQPNTVIPLGLVTVILNEQHYDNQGHGMTVNAIHVFTSGDLGSLANVDLIIGHAHSEDMCAEGTVSTPPSNPNSSGQQLPVGVKADSTKHADPGEIVTYTLTITVNGCEVIDVVDYLPATFTYVDGSASGDLGTPTVGQVQSNPSQQTLEWYNASGISPSSTTLHETLKVKVPTNAQPGDYVNNVAGESAPPISNPAITCGSFVFSDTLATNGPIPANNGTNPGVIVPRPATATPTPTPVASVQAQSAATPAPTPVTAIPNTARPAPAAWAGPFALAMLGGVLALRRRTRRR